MINMDGQALEDMKSFDFSETLNKTINYYDGDENDNKEDLRTKLDDLHQQEHFTVGYSMPNIDCTFNEETNIVRKKRAKSNKSTKKNKVIKNKKLKFKSYVPKEIRDESESIKRKCNSSTSKEYNVHSHYVSNNQLDSDSKEDTENKDEESSKQYKDKEDVPTQKAICQTDDLEHNKKQDTSIQDIPQKEKENFEELTSYLKEMLDTLSQMLVLSVEAYRNHVKRIEKLIADPNNSILVHESKTQLSLETYFRWKCHYYQLSYCAAANLLLPQENKINTKFTEDFLNKTVQYANNKMNYICSKEELQPFYFELIEWTKKRQEFLKGLQTNINQPRPMENESDQLRLKQSVTSRNPRLKQALSQPSINLQTTIPLETNLETIFTGGDSGRQIVISADKTTHRQINNTINHVTSSRENNYPLNQVNYHPQSRSSPTSSTNRNSIEYIQNTTLHNNNTPTERIRATNIYNNIHQYCPVNSSRQYNDQRYQRMNTEQVLPPPPYFSTYNRHSFEHQQQYHAGYNTRHANITQPPLPQQQQQRSFPNFTKQNEPVNQTVEHSRSSVSTDSGLASPLEFNTSTDRMVSSSEDRQVVPLITHVTSLNPKAQHIMEGYCFICTARTKTKCLGCLQIYYCSSICQTIDWNVHKEICRKVQDARSVNTTC